MDASDPASPISAYGRSKLAGEERVLALAGLLPVSILRPPVIFGPRDRMRTQPVDLRFDVRSPRQFARLGHVQQRRDGDGGDETHTDIRIATPGGSFMADDEQNEDDKTEAANAHELCLTLLENYPATKFLFSLGGLNTSS